jgi:hypothetical protein
MPLADTITGSLMALRWLARSLAGTLLICWRIAIYWYHRKIRLTNRYRFSTELAFAYRRYGPLQGQAACRYRKMVVWAKGEPYTTASRAGARLKRMGCPSASRGDGLSD